MATADSQADVELAGGQGSGAKPAIWLDGDVLACACPDCGSPMSIRLWLMVADCWRCGASLELSEELEQQALRLLEQRDRKQSQAPAPKKQEQKPAAAAKPKVAPAAKPQHQPAPMARPKDSQPKESRPKESRPKDSPKQEAPKGESPKPAFTPAPPTARKPTPRAKPAVFRDAPPPRNPTAAETPGRVRQRLGEVEEEGEVKLFFRDMFRNLPAWLASAILHMVLLILLASIFFMEEPEPERPLILSTRVGPLEKEGGEEEQQPEPVEFEDPGEEEPEPEEPEIPEPVEEPAEEPVEDAEPLGDEEETFDPFGQPGAGRGASSLVGRSATSRSRLAQHEGGTIESEAAVTRGLEWLVRHQNSDGSWSLNAFHRAGDCNGRCNHRGGHSDTAATAMALLPFLGAGQTHQEGNYTDAVDRGLQWLVREQRNSGDLRGRGVGRMYAHGQCAIVLCEAFALTRDERLRVPAQLALDFIVEAQHRGGGWRYNPGQPGDTSVVGWQLMALRSGQMAYLSVPPGAFEDAGRFLDTAGDDEGARYGYMPNSRPTPAMTAEALLCRQYSGWPRNHPGMISGCKWLLEEHPPRRSKPDLYYWYYATQVFHHMGGPLWERWNEQMRDLLVDLQEDSGHPAGSWDPLGRGHVDSTGGRLYATSLSICTLEVYYRHMPLYRRLAVEE